MSKKKIISNDKDLTEEEKELVARWQELRQLPD